MKNTKRRLETFSWFDYTGIAAHLSKMAESGWLLEKISNFGWTYRRIPPKKMAFYVSYYPKASEFDPEPAEGQKIFHDFCKHTGWVLAAAAAQMQIFYNEKEHPVPIETDPALEVSTIHAAMKKSFLPVHFLLLLLAVLNSVLYISTWSSDPVGLLSDNTHLFAGFAWCMVFLSCICELASYFIWYVKAKKLAERGEFAQTSGHSHIQRMILAVVLAGFAYWLATVFMSGSAMWKTISISMILYIAALIILINGIKQFLKRRKTPRTVNLTLTLLSCFLLSAVMLGTLTYSILQASQKGLFAQGRETYEYNGATFTVYQDELPLTVQDLLDIPKDGYVKEHSGNESLFLGRFEMKQYPRYDSAHFSDMPELSYAVTEIKFPSLYEFCKESLLESEQDDIQNGKTVFVNHYEPVDPAPWRAEDAYQLRWSSGYVYRYLLCYNSRIVEIRFGWEPSEEQMGVTADKLGCL